MPTHEPSRLSCTLNSACDCIHILRSVVEVMGARVGMDDVQTNRMVLAVDELFANINRHGYKGNCGTIELTAELDEDALKFVFRDYAPPIHNQGDLRGRKLEAVRPGGLGLHLIDAVMDEFHHEARADGNNWTLIRHLKGRHDEHRDS